MAVVNKGQKILIITRRLFEGDLRRHFAGVIEEVSEPLVRVAGYVFVYEETKNAFVRRDEERQRVFSLADAGLVIILLPESVEISSVQYRTNFQGQRVFTDGRSLSLNISEFDVKS